MNAKDRKALAEALSLLEQANGILTELRDTEEEKVENMREKWESTDRFQEMEATLEALQSGCDSLEDAISNLEGA